MNFLYKTLPIYQPFKNIGVEESINITYDVTRDVGDT